MVKEITAVGKDILEAKENARAALGVGELDDVQFEVIDGGTKGFFGFMARPAKVRAYIEIADNQEKRQRSERPKKDRAQTSESNQPKRENVKNNNNNNNNKKHNKPEQKAAKPEQKNEEAKSKVIPEAELKMELKVVEAGEDMSFDFINTLISDIGLAAEAKLYSCEDGTRRITIEGEDASALIGHHGDTLDALQYLANLACAKKNSKGERDKSRVTIDIEGYRKKREETLRALARRMAAKALRNKRSVMLEPMTAYERRIIHSEIQGIDGVSTNSVGSDNNRKIVIFLTGKKPRELFDEDAKNSELAKEFEATEDEEITRSFEAVDVSASTDSDETDDSFSVEQIRPADDVFDSGEEIQ